MAPYVCLRRCPYVATKGAVGDTPTAGLRISFGATVGSGGLGCWARGLGCHLVVGREGLGKVEVPGGNYR
jgi:hypothetical protein